MKSVFLSFLRRVLGNGLPAAACAAALLLCGPASAGMVYFQESGVSAKGTNLTVSGSFVTSGTNLTITLRSFGDPTRFADDVLSSFYFNIADPDDGIRPVLTYVSGSGSAWEVRAGAADTRTSWSPLTQTWTAGSAALSDLVASKDDDEGWQFKTISPPPTYPGLGFGIGTVGNSAIGAIIPGATGTFDGNVVSGAEPGSMINLGIYSVGSGSDIDPQGVLDGRRLVRTEAVFHFESSKVLDTLDENWVQGNVTFGFGTAPDSVLLPEPGTLPMLGSAGVVALGWLVRRMRRGGAARA